MIITIIAFIIVFGILVFVHEFGHFIVAKKSGIMVREFSIGMGPKLFYYRHNSTTYTVRLLPLGGYVRMAGSADNESQELEPGTPVSLQFDDNQVVNSINTSKKQTLYQGLPLEVTNCDLEKNLFIEGFENGNEESKKRYTVSHDAVIIEHDGTAVQIAPNDVQFQNAPVWKKLITNFAGIFNNILLAVIAFSILSFLQGGAPSNTNTVNVTPNNSVARDAGIKNGDKILSIDGQKTNTWKDLTVAIQSKPNQKVNLKIANNDAEKNISLKTQSAKSGSTKYGVIGVTQTLNHSFIAKALSGFNQTWNFTKLLVTKLISMFSGHFSLNDLGGPVAIFANTSQAAKLGIDGIVYFIAFLSINLAIINFIPIPALDGGKILLNIIEAIRRKPASEKVETIVTLVGFAFIVILMILVTLNDIQRYFLH
ncbi:RIP metalloprotease RseP [Apilactobacillus micheneri]|uniref:Zinc metalloprotease n=1 Tax=Apilactobacillus micheneri TaxID=1899430 RepID=A0A9Q8INZ2_9LACO|nr:RIP metalloprotease RseP [Apilactobacillus micheneri]TPR40739.1 RIP metalloprotease RseP [Apilactobacillus micheneri]TPR42206.1 RIP metalloprotease RseP [Apilactobacillus micheneri]TPR44861.1 RIP metalloprotease RseP [Apilactobacillus micheneri]TPR45160.1 RIP metalloprotease RseP [Apilactobacillus micheneri]TPR46502.1 RIP metalloprotease RseP [Apilactobacillus micheneri]